MESIKAWLNGNRDYKAGVNLFLRISKDKLLIRLFSEDVISPFKKTRLVDAMKAMLTSNQDAKQDSTAKVHGAIIKARAEDKPFESWSETMDETETALHLQWKPMFVEMMDLCSRVGDISRSGNEKLAGEMALRILDLDDACDEIYRERDHYIKNGQLPDQQPYGDPCVDPNLIPKALENAKRYVRQYRGKLDKDPSNVNASEQLKKHQWFVDHYKKVLKLD